jgi:ABC-2 type transport system permease protein
MLPQAKAIVWVQWRSIVNGYPGRKGGNWFSTFLTLAWYCICAFLAFVVFKLVSDVKDPAKVRQFLAQGLLFATGYWQMAPVILATTGLSLDLRKLIVYPIPHTHLFLLELLLRTSTSLEVLLITAGAALGVLANRALPWWGVLAFVPFIFFNLLLSAGVTEFQKRILARKYLREAAVLLVVLLGAIPQFLLTTGYGTKVKLWYLALPSLPLPWSATADLATGAGGGIAMALASMAAWALLAWWFGRSQFERGLRFDAEAQQSSSSEPVNQASHWSELFYGWPAWILPDPLGVLIEKELRSLARSPRFRLVFFMGFSFGLIIWLPLLGGVGPGQKPSGFTTDNFLTLVSAYALLLLGEVCFLNCFGFDRSGAQAYWVMPVTLRQSLISKNVAALWFILLEISLITLVCGLVGMPVTGTRVGQALLVCLTMAILLMSIGNLTSVNNPRAVNPNRSMRSTPPGKTQALLLLIYPLTAGPVALAYLAEYGFETVWAFYGVMAFNLAIAGVVYTVALESAVETAHANREEIVAALSRGDGPVTG